MTLNNLVSEYRAVKEIIDTVPDFMDQAEELMANYSRQMKEAFSFYFNGTANNPQTNLANSVINCLNSINLAVLHLNSQTRKLYKCIALLENQCQSLSNSVLSQECSAFIKAANTSIDIMYNIIENQPEKSRKKGLYHDLLDSLTDLLQHYHHIFLLYDHVAYIESALYEPLPDGIEESEINLLEIKSEKECTDLHAYSEDIQKLSQFLTQFEMLKSPGKSHTIFTRKFENGSLRIVLGSKEIELSCISDIINTLVSAIRSFAVLPSDLRMRKLEEQAKQIENDTAQTDLNAKKLTIINSQIDILTEKLGLDVSKPEHKEKVQLLCLPLVDYLDHNPVGSVNDATYNLTQELHLLENKAANS